MGGHFAAWHDVEFSSKRELGSLASNPGALAPLPLLVLCCVCPRRYVLGGDVHI